MKSTRIPQYLFAASAVLFGICAALQFMAGHFDLGLLFGVLAVVGLTLFGLLRSGRITW